MSEAQICPPLTVASRIRHPKVISAVCAVYGEFRGLTNWETTALTGSHREPVHTAALVGDGGK